MDGFLGPLIQKAVLEIIDYNYNKKAEMVQLNRKIPCCVMSYLKSGEAVLRVKGKEYYCKAGDAIYVPPNVEHDHHSQSALRHPGPVCYEAGAGVAAGPWHQSGRQAAAYYGRAGAGVPVRPSQFPPH